MIAKYRSAAHSAHQTALRGVHVLRHIRIAIRGRRPSRRRLLTGTARLSRALTGGTVRSSQGAAKKRGKLDQSEVLYNRKSPLELIYRGRRVPTNLR